MAYYSRAETGKDAEQEACRYLERKGLRLLEKNYRCPQGEIDLIMQDQDDIVFVEVRCRSSNDHGLAIETIDEYKQRKLVKAALFFLQKKRWLYTVTSRFDVVAIQGNKFEWIKNAFEEIND